MRTASAVWVLIFSGVAAAQSKTVIVAAGDCADPSLINAGRDFRDIAGKLLGAQLMEPESVLDIVRPRPMRSLQDIERQVDSAKALFYGGQDDRALELVERALTELERASPEAKHWTVTQNALVLAALVQKNLDHVKEMNDAFRRIVRLDPTFKLDPDAHPPSAIAALEAIKKEFARGRKATLQVRVEAGPAATVYVDGLPMGATPLKIELPAGTYRVSLGSPGMLSFPHRVELPRDTKLNVDLAFEGSLALQTPLCLSSTDDGAAVKLAQLVAAEKVIVLRNAARRTGPPFISGALFDLASGQQERAGSVTDDLMAKLATFLITGKEDPSVRVNGPVKPVAAAPKDPVKEPVKVVVKEPVKEPVNEPVKDPPPPAPIASAPTFEVSGSSVSAGRVGSVTLLSAGAASVIVGAIVFGLGSADRERLEGITRPDGTLPLYELPVGQEAIERMKAVDANRALSFALIGGGVGAATAGVLGLLLFPARTTSVGMSASPSGASVQVRGSF